MDKEQGGELDFAVVARPFMGHALVEINTEFTHGKMRRLLVDLERGQLTLQEYTETGLTQINLSSAEMTRLVRAWSYSGDIIQDVPAGRRIEVKIRPS